MKAIVRATVKAMETENSFRNIGRVSNGTVKVASAVGQSGYIALATCLEPSEKGPPVSVPGQ